MELFAEQAYKDAQRIQTQFEQLLKPHQEMMRRFNVQFRPALEVFESINKTMTQSLKPYQDMIQQFNAQLRPTHEAIESINKTLNQTTNSLVFGETQRATLRVAELSRGAIDFESKTLTVPPPPAYKDPEVIATLVAEILYKRISEQQAHVIGTREKTALRIDVPENIQYKDVLIEFLGITRLAIWINGHKQERDYRKLGFEDKRNGKPNKQWFLLQLLAIKEGSLPWEEYRFQEKLQEKDRHRFEKQMSLLGRSLRELFHIEEDSFYPYSKEEGYRTKLRITGKRLIESTKERDPNDKFADLPELYDEQTPIR